MMDPSTGAIEILPDNWKIGDALPDHAPDNAVILHGALEDIHSIGRRVKLGQKELEARTARRKAQRASRRRNR